MAKAITEDTFRKKAATLRHHKEEGNPKIVPGVLPSENVFVIILKNPL
jgi:hypothetical protein